MLQTASSQPLKASTAASPLRHAAPSRQQQQAPHTKLRLLALPHPATVQPGAATSVPRNALTGPTLVTTSAPKSAPTTSGPPPHPPPGTSDDGFRHLKLDLPAAQHTLVKTSVFVKSSTALKDCPADKLPEFAVIGRSNVGKSSLINALTQNDKLAKVSKEPGGLRGT